MDISVRTETLLAENRSWLGSAHGTDATRTVTLDLSTFTPEDYVNGVIPSGKVVGPITASGLYGKYDAAASDGRQTAAGFLFNSTSATAGAKKVGAPLLEHGAVVEAKLPAGHGLDEAAKTTLAAHFIIR